MEDQGLIGNHFQLHHHRAGRLGDLGELSTGLGEFAFPIGSPGDDQQGRLVRQFFRAGHGQPMLPERSIDLVGREPRLRSQVDDGDLTPAEVGSGRHLPGKGCVGLGDISVERRFRAVERGRIGSGPGVGHNAAQGQQACGDQKKAGRNEHRPQNAIGRRPGNARAMGRANAENGPKFLAVQSPPGRQEYRPMLRVRANRSPFGVRERNPPTTRGPSPR
jgi:hypothetical protein